MTAIIHPIPHNPHDREGCDAINDACAALSERATLATSLIQRRHYAERYEDAQIEAQAWAQYQKQTEHHK